MAAINGRIAWGLFSRFDDFADHLMMAERFAESGRPPMPHFLFHGLTALLWQFVPSLLTAGALVVIAAHFLLGLATYYVIWTALKDHRLVTPFALALITTAMLLAYPITNAQTYAIGYLWPHPFHSPTYTLMKPFAVATFFGTAWVLLRRDNVGLARAVAFSTVSVLAALSKPSLAICLLPAAAVVTVYRRWRQLPVPRAAVVAALHVPVLLVLTWQFLVTFSGFDVVEGMHRDGIVWAPLQFMRYWTTGLSLKFVLSTLFPLTVAALYWQSARTDPLLQLAWLCFSFGAVYTYGAAESIYLEAGDFAWSAYITLFMLFVASIIFWLRQSLRSLGPRVAICGAVLALHVASGARITFLYTIHHGCNVDLRSASFVCD